MNGTAGREAAPEVRVRLPEWLLAETRGGPIRTSPADRMALVLGWARRNVEQETGGPFAAGVFEADTGRLVAPGVNRVVPERCAAAHAEVVALSAAQRRLGTHDLSPAAAGELELVASADPCVMCFGAIHWCGIARLVCGARSSDVEACGFDEGPVPEDWTGVLDDRGVSVTRDVGREEARAVLELYRQRGGPIYNPGRGEG